MSKRNKANGKPETDQQPSQSAIHQGASAGEAAGQPDTGAAPDAAGISDTAGAAAAGLVESAGISGGTGAPPVAGEAGQVVSDGEAQGIPVREDTAASRIGDPDGADQAAGAAASNSEGAAEPAAGGGGEAPPYIAVIVHVEVEGADMLVELWSNDIEGNRVFGVMLDELQALKGLHPADWQACTIDENAEGVTFWKEDGTTIAVTLVELRTAWEAENGEPLFPELLWPGCDREPVRHPNADPAPATDEQIAASAARKPIDYNMMAAVTAAAIVFGTNGDEIGKYPTVDYRWLYGDRDPEPPAIEATAFLRANRDALPETLVIHLRLKGYRNVPDGSQSRLCRPDGEEPRPAERGGRIPPATSRRRVWRA